MQNECLCDNDYFLVATSVLGSPMAAQALHSASRSDLLIEQWLWGGKLHARLLA